MGSTRPTREITPRTRHPTSDLSVDQPHCESSHELGRTVWIACRNFLETVIPVFNCTSKWLVCDLANFLETAIPVFNFASKLLARDLLPASKLSGNRYPRVQLCIQVAGARSIACKRTFWKQRSPCSTSHPSCWARSIACKRTFWKQRSLCSTSDPSCWRAIYCLPANFLETVIPVFNFASKWLARDLLPASKLSGNSDPHVRLHIQVVARDLLPASELSGHSDPRVPFPF